MKEVLLLLSLRWCVFSIADSGGYAFPGAKWLPKHVAVTLGHFALGLIFSWHLSQRITSSTCLMMPCQACCC